MDELWSGVPEFPRFKDLTLEDKPPCDQLFTLFPPVISEFTFTNLFIWRHAYQLKISRFKNFLCLLSDPGENCFFFPPIGEGDMVECYRILLQYLEGKGAPSKIARVPEALFAKVVWEGEGFIAELDRAQSDYHYLTEDINT